MPAIARLRRIPYLSLGGLGIVILAIVGALLLNRSQIEANRWIAHTMQVELTLSHIMVDAARLESAHRGQLLFRDERSLEGMEGAIERIRIKLATLKDLVADNPRQNANAKTLEKLVEGKIAFARQSVALVQSGRAAEATALVGQGKGRMLIRAIILQCERMIRSETSLLEARSLKARRLVGGLSIGLVAAMGLIVLIAVIVLMDAWRRFDALTAATREAEAAEAAAYSEMKAREAAEEQVRQMQKMESIGQLTGGIAHDFNNMLAIVIGSLDLAERRLTNDPQRAIQSIVSAREGAERAATLTARLLAFARQQPLAPVPLEVNRLVSNMSELLRRTIGETVSIETVLAGGLWPTFADPGQLENAILNLAVNARDAMPRGGKLTIETANAYLDDNYAKNRGDVQAGQYVMIGISDTGLGMSEEIVRRAFDPFFTTKEVGKGTGLGLSQVFGFLKQSGGHVAIYSEEGQGTTIKLYLPRYLGSIDEAERSGSKSAAAIAGGTAEEIILVVEDEQRVRHFSVDALRELGYTVISASSGRQALEALKIGADVSLLFTDIVMPEMDGRRLADTACADRPDLKVLYTTGYTRNAVVHNGMLDAGVAFLQKPFTIDQLAQKIRAVLDGEGVNREANV